MSANGVLAASSLSYGSYLFYVQVADSAGHSTISQLALAVSNAQVSLGSPQLGGGYVNAFHRFTFHFTDPQGPSAISSGQIVFNTNTLTPGAGTMCQLDWNTGHNLNISGIVFGNFGSGALISPNCAVDAAGSTLSQTSQGYDVSVNVSFTSQFPTRTQIPVWVRSTNTSGATSSYAPAGAWSLASAASPSPGLIDVGIFPEGGGYCGGAITLGGVLNRYSNGTLAGGILARTDNVGAAFGWQNRVSNGWLSTSSGVVLDDTIQHYPASQTSSDYQQASLALYSSTAPGSDFQIAGDYDFSNPACYILLDPGSFGFTDEAGAAHFWGYTDYFNLPAPAGDTTPHIDYITELQPVVAGGSAEVYIDGSNFGFSGTTGDISFCQSSIQSPCNTSSTVSVTSVVSWNSSRIDAFVTAAGALAGTYYAQVTSHGATGTFAPAPQQQALSNNAPLKVIAFTVDPSQISLSTGDTNKTIRTTVTPSAPFTVAYSAGTAPFVQPPGAPCATTLSFSNLTGVGSVVSTVRASPPNCAGLFGVRAIVASTQDPNFVVVTVPPQALIRQMVGAAGGFPLSVDPAQVAQKSVGIAAKNRFGLPEFSGWTTWQQFQDAGFIENSATANGPPVVIDNAVAVYSGAITSDFVGGGRCYWSPQYQDEWVPLRNQYQSNPNATTLPSGVQPDGSPIHLRLPECYTQPGQYQQVIWKISEPANIRTDAGGVYLNAPAFLFVKQRNSGDRAIIQIP